MGILKMHCIQGEESESDASPHAETDKSRLRLSADTFRVNVTFVS